MNQQRIIRFTGSVQGVGFRYTACRIAGGYEITGYVRNCPDGSVECVAEGDRNEIDRFLADLGDAMGNYIDKVTQQITPFSGEFQIFTVKF